MALRRWWRARGDGGLPGGRGIPPAPATPTGGGRAPRPERPEPPELVEIEVGVDRFGAGALVARLEASGIPVRLLTMDDHGLAPGLHQRHQHRILIRADDEERVRSIIERTGS